MKSYKEMSIDAKNKRRAKPSGKIHTKAAKKVKLIHIEWRYVGPAESGASMFRSDFFSRAWRDCNRYKDVKAAEQAVKTLNRKEHGNWEYRVKPNNETTKAPKGTS